MTAYDGATWKVGTKDDRVYVELWTAQGLKVMDFDLVPESAYKLGQALMERAIIQGHKP